MGNGVRVNGVEVGSAGAVVSDAEELPISSTTYGTLGRPIIFPNFTGLHMKAKVVALASIGTFDIRLKARGTGQVLFEKTGINNTVDEVVDLGPPLARLASEDIVDVQGRVGSAGDAATLKSIYVRL